MSGTHPGDDDPFHPPDIPTEVHCLHCGQEYESYLMEWRDSAPGSAAPGKWCCPTPGCHGAGFGFDILPTDPEWTDPHGELEISYGGGDDDEDDDDEDDDDDENAIEIFSIETGDGDEIPFDDEADEAELEIQIEFVDDAGSEADGDDGEGDEEDF